MTGRRVNAFEEAAGEHRVVLAAAVDALSTVFDDVAALVGDRLVAGRTVFACGNGGSAADAQHFAAELVGRFAAVRRALPVMALHTDTSALTAIANDSGFEHVFSRQLEAFGRPGDVLLGISTSGNSPNVVEAASTARQRGLTVVALTGDGGGHLATHADHLLAVPSTVVARVQEVHEIVLHSLAAAIETRVLSTEGAGDA